MRELSMDSMFRSQFLHRTLSNYHRLGRHSSLVAYLLHLRHHIASWRHSPENGVFPIEPACLDCCYEELAPVRIGACVGHRQTELFVLQWEVLVVEATAVYRPATCPISSCEVPALDHEVWNYSVELAAHVGQFLPSFDDIPLTESHEVSNSLWHNSPE